MTKAIKDAAYWDQLHIRSDKSPAVDLRPPSRGDRLRRLGAPLRTERGGCKEI